MRLVRRAWAGLLLAGVLGCGGESADAVAVSGTVTRDGNPLPDAVVTFHPEGATKGLGGSGRTGADGRYTLTPARGGKGIPPGDYTVVVSRPLRPDGSPPDPNVPPIESDARETLPAIYSNRDASTLRAKVSQEAKVHDFALKTTPKKQ
jgi:hypothetical protein